MNGPTQHIPRWLSVRDRIFAALTLLLAFLLPVGGHLLPPVIAVLGLAWFADTRWGERFDRFRAKKQLLLPMLLYAIYALSLLETENMERGMFQLESKLGFVVLPLMFGSNHWTEGFSRRGIVRAFVAGCALAALLCLGNAVYELFHERYLVRIGAVHDTYISWDFFFASRLSFLIHPSYLAMYICLAMFFVFRMIFGNWAARRKTAWALVLLNLGFAGFSFLLASRLGYLTLFLLFTGVVVGFVRRRRMYLQGLLLFAGVVALILLMYKTSDIVASRFDYAIKSFTAAEVDKTSTESSAVRRLIWGVAAGEIAKNMLTGVGAGDVQEVLLDRYAQEGMTGALEHKLNAHSQFLQTFMAAGIAAFLTLLLLLFVPLVTAIRRKDSAAVVFLVLVLLNILVESMFEVQSGVLFFAFFFSVFSALPAKSETA